MKYLNWILVAGVLYDMLRLLWLVLTFDEWQYGWRRFPEALPIVMAAGLLATLVGVAMLMSGKTAGGISEENAPGRRRRRPRRSALAVTARGAYTFAHEHAIPDGGRKHPAA